MTKQSEVILISESPVAHGVGVEVSEIRRVRICSVKSVGQTEVYQAAGAGLNPEVKLVLAYESEYNGEKICEFRGERWRILRTYIPETNGIELTLQREAKNAARGV